MRFLALAFCSAVYGHGWLCDPPARNVMASNNDGTKSGAAGSCGAPQRYKHLLPSGFAFGTCPNCFYTNNPGKLTKEEVLNHQKPVHHFGPPCTDGEGPVGEGRQKYKTTSNKDFGVSMKYKGGSVVDVETYLTITHTGYMWFDYACVDDHPNVPTQDPSIKWERVKIVKADGEISPEGINHLPDSYSGRNYYTYKLQVQMPAKQCSHAVFQWNWYCTHVWGEHFRNCADISVSQGDAPVTEAPTTTAATVGTTAGGDTDESTPGTEVPELHGEDSGGPDLKIVAVAAGGVVVLLAICALVARSAMKKPPPTEAAYAPAPYESSRKTASAYNSTPYRSSHGNPAQYRSSPYRTYGGSAGQSSVERSRHDGRRRDDSASRTASRARR